MKKILLTGATGYIGKRLLGVLLENGYHVVCCTRDESRFELPDEYFKDQISIAEVDFLDETTLDNIPKDIDAAYYLLHSMSGGENFEERELRCARNFNKAVKNSNLEQTIYLTGMVNTNELSQHLESRKKVEEELEKGDYHLTALRAGIIIGSGSASYEIIRDLVEKIPILVAPKGIDTKCQPIGIANVLDFLYETLFLKETYDRNFDIAGPDVLTYKEMLLGYAESRGLERAVVSSPWVNKSVAAYLLQFITSTNYELAKSLVHSLQIDVVARDNEINRITGVQPFSYKKALERTQSKIEANEIISTWRDSYTQLVDMKSLSQFVEVPDFGVFKDIRTREITDRKAVLDRIWSIGGETGWYYGNFLWNIRGIMDELIGGVGLRRGRAHPTKIFRGDSLDFWRVILADKEEGRLLLYAEMKVPGEAWLEFSIKDNILTQKAVFRPKGIWGRLYWYSLLPFHGFLFNGMINRLAFGYPEQNRLAESEQPKKLQEGDVLEVEE